MKISKLFNLQIALLALATVVVGLMPVTTHAQSLSLERVASGLSAPIFVTHAPGDADRIFIAQRSGAIRIMNLNSGALSTFTTVPSVDTFFEGGLLGMAFHPDFETNGFFYVNYTLSVGGGFRTRIARFTSTNGGISANSNTLQVVLEVDQPQGNHNAGWIGFGLDGLLYIATGDGGNANDLGAGHTAGIGNSQDITNNLLGKMLRVDVDGDDFPTDNVRNYAIPAGNTFVNATGDDEILLYGLRNPFRCSFDRLTGDLYIGDVGQGQREEVNLYPAAGNPDRNMGWRLREGTISTPSVGGPQPADGVDPIYDYLRFGNFGGSSLTGGMVYRGPISALNGVYFFADFNSNNMWAFRYDGTDPSTFDGDNHTPVIRWNGVLSTDVGVLSNIVCFGDDLAGNMYIVDIGGEVFRVADGELAILGDINGDGSVNLLDVAPFVDAISNGVFSYEADINGDGMVNLLDVGAFVNVLSGG